MRLHKKYLSFIFILQFISISLFAAADEEKSETTSESKFPAKLPEKSTWETIVSFPGKVVSLPFYCVFKTASATIEYLDETRIAAKVGDMIRADDRQRGLVPVYTSRSGGGIKIYQRNLLNPNSKLSLTLMAGVNQRQNYNLEFKRVRLAGGLSRFFVQYTLLADEPFFGLGLNSDIHDKSNFANEQKNAAFSFDKNLNRRLTIGFQTGWESNRIFHGKNKSLKSTTDLFNSVTLPGLGEEIQIGRFQLKANWDSRNRSVIPTAGWEASLVSGLFVEPEEKEFGFCKLTFNVRRYMHLFYNRYLIFRLAAEATRPWHSRQIPFYYLSELGWRETLRGFERGRFRDRDLVLSAAEYHFPIFQRKNSGIETCLFFDAGQVAYDLAEHFKFKRFKCSAGCGIRLYNDEELLATIEFARSPEGFKFYLVLN